MKRFALLLTGLLLVQPASATDSHAQHEQAIGDVFSALTEAWRNADGAAWGAQFVEDADFTVWFGLELKGREAIANGHQFIFDKVYAGTVFELDVRQLRFIGDSSAVVHLNGYVVADGDSRPEAPDALPIAVLQNTSDGWQIVAFHNTANIVRELGGSATLASFKALVAKAMQDQ